MRKLIFVTLLLISFDSFAQTRVGLRGGLNFSNFITGPQSPGDKSYSGTLLTRINAGLQIEIPLNDDDNWFLYTGPYYAGKGNRVRNYWVPNFDTIVTRLNYIELPVSVVYKFFEGNNKRLVAGAGIFSGYGFGGKVLYYNDPEHTIKNLHKPDKRYKRFDAGFNIITALEIDNRFGIRLDYSRSLFDISRYKWKEHNNTFGFSFFWYLNSKKEENE